ncbi:MAG: alpha-L-rhamnosidase N-terminal domain-containing protein [Lentisphaeria bacterium]|nr:alpha-L-rhamnosidase N-terminal domain-containing protein [Lentisphaeria bacterium]
MVHMNAREKNQELFPGAKWLWHTCCRVDSRDVRAQFRRTFEIDAVPEQTEIHITADSRYNLWINGTFVNHGPARGFQSHWPFDRIDIAPYLKKGKNVIAVLVYQFGVSIFCYRYENASGFLMSGKVGSVDLATGEQWKGRVASGYIPNIARGSFQYGYQEYFDCREDKGNWLDENYDDSDWLSTPGASLGCMPWHSFEERNIPLQTKEVISASGRVAISCHEPAEGWEKLENVAKIYDRETPDWKAAPEQGNTVQFASGITAQLIDFGKEVVGQPIFDIDNATDGDMLDYLVCESLTGETPDFGSSENPFATLFGGRLILKEGKNHHELTIPWGFRYVVVLYRGKQPLKVTLTARRIWYSLDVKGSFLSSDPLLNDIWEMCVHTQRCCMVDAYTDCPWRESAQWWGDALVQAQNTFRLANDTRLFERGLRQIAAQGTPEGLPYAIAPSNGHSCILPDYTAMWIVTLLAHYNQTGSLKMYFELKKTVDDILNYFRSLLNKDGLLVYDDRYWLFLDWCPNLFKNGVPTVYNLIYYWSLKAASTLAELAGETDRKNSLDQEISALNNAMKEHLFDSKTGLLYDGLNWDGSPVKTMSPHAAAMAILQDFMPEQHDFWMEKILLPFIGSHRDSELKPTSYFMFYVFEAMKKKGKRAEILDCIRRWWKDFLDHGFSTTAESWPDQLDRGFWSICHAWSAHPIFHFSELILGVHPEEAGWKTVSFDPVMTKGEKASGTIPSPLGLIRAEWDWTGEEPVRKIELPDGMKLL